MGIVAAMPDYPKTGVPSKEVLERAARGMAGLGDLGQEDGSPADTLSERIAVDLGGESFNAINQVNFGLPGHSAGTPGSGVISSAAPGGQTQRVARVRF